MNKRKTTASTTKTAKGPRAARRLDVVVAEQSGLSRERAQALILAGHVTIDGVAERKSAAIVRSGAAIHVQARDRYVSRGGHKLEQALREFGWSPAQARCLDVGASTGGFTDCLLQHGAASVVALDVGYGHLAWSLRQDERVTVVERCNFRHADLAALGAPFTFISADVSFIALGKLVEQFRAGLAGGGKLIVLVKPQFEAGRAAVQRGGVVRDAATQIETIERVVTQLSDAGLKVEKTTYSPLKGPAGNIEFLLGARAADADGAVSAARQKLDVAGVVRKSHEALD